MSKTRVTPKYQTTIPREIRERLGIKAGDQVNWTLVGKFAVVRPVVKIKDPVTFLTSQMRLDLNAVTWVKRARAETF